MRTITSERLVLRPWHDDDADFLPDLDATKYYDTVNELFEIAAPSPL